MPIFSEEAQRHIQTEGTPRTSPGYHVLFHKYLSFALFTSGLIFLSLILSIELFLRNVGESFNANDIVKTQLAAKPNKCLAGQKLTNFIFPYKKALTEHIHPTVLALGSSRVAQIRESFFTVPFVNAGVAMTSIEEGNKFFNDVIAGSAAQPKLVILGMDIWWFNENYVLPTTISNDHIYDNYKAQSLPLFLFPQNFSLVYKGLQKGAISMDQFLKGASGILPNNCGIGIEGRFNMTGFGPDGSSYYIERMAGQEKGDLRFQDSLKKIQSGDNPHIQFAHGKSVSLKQLHQFIALLSKLKARKIRTILFFPPFPKTIHLAIANRPNAYGYIGELKDKLTKFGVPYYDFTDPTVLGSSDCEFFDGIHGGEVIYARIIKTIYERDPSIRTFIDIHYLEKVISHYQGHTFVPDKTVTSLEEVDFLEMGCRKSKVS